MCDMLSRPLPCKMLWFGEEQLKASVSCVGRRKRTKEYYLSWTPAWTTFATFSDYMFLFRLALMAQLYRHR